MSKIASIVDGPHPARSPAAAVSKPAFGIIALIVVLAAVLRVLGAFNDLWLDEVWSLKTARGMPSWWAAFTSLHHEINHYLNTIWLHVTQTATSPVVHRLPSLMAGIGSVIMAGMVGARRGRAAAIFAALLIGFSYVLVLYASEARGYSTAVFLALTSYYSFLRYRETGARKFAVVFSVCGILGLASHLTFASVLGAAAVCSLHRHVRMGWSTRRFLSEALALYALPFVFLVGLYFLDIRYIEEGGGSSASLIDSFGTALAWAAGTFGFASAKFVSCIVAVAAFATAMRILDREEMFFFLGVVVGFPALLILARASDTIYTRHFVLSIVFLLIATSYLLAAMFQRTALQRASTLLIVGLFLVINGCNIVRLLQYGRGHLQEAVRYMARTGTNPTEITVCGSQDFRVVEILEFYGPKNSDGKNINYFRHGTWPRTGTEFLIAPREASDPPTPPAEKVGDGQGQEFRLVKVFPAAPLSGMHWFIYQNSSALPPAK